jgi:hypothetical protein
MLRMCALTSLLYAASSFSRHMNLCPAWAVSEKSHNKSVLAWYASASSSSSCSGDVNSKLALNQWVATVIVPGGVPHVHEL